MSRNTKPQFTRKRVNKAGESVRAGNVSNEDVLVIENWRAAHNKILNDWQAALRGRCRGKDIAFAQRLKRKSTISDKLARQPDMLLSRMHDIAGCRLIFKNITELNEYRNNLHKSRMKHERRKKEEIPYPYDYISNPHPDKSGYRGIHDIYKYKARLGRDNAWDDLLVEIQYRTDAQNSWATANEIAGFLTGNQSKFGKGSDDQKEFFRLSSEIIARNEENLFSCYPGTSKKSLIDKFMDIEKKTNLLRSLKAIKTIPLEAYKSNNIILIQKEDSIKVNYYDTFTMAQLTYFAMEKMLGDTANIVLVRASSLEDLRKAYKNYFSDAKGFTRMIDSGIKNLR